MYVQLQDVDTLNLSFSNSHYNSVVPTQDEVPPPTILEQHCDAVVID